jgi:hypothetical protein
MKFPRIKNAASCHFGTKKTHTVLNLSDMLEFIKYAKIRSQIKNQFILTLLIQPAERFKISQNYANFNSFYLGKPELVVEFD